MRFSSILLTGVGLVWTAGCAPQATSSDDDGGPVDKGESPTPEVDHDGDGYSVSAGDCDDADASLSPGAEELCDRIDNDCDGEVDDDPSEAPVWYADADDDGVGGSGDWVMACSRPAGYAATSSDCDDTDPGINPAASELPGNGIDEDCDGSDDIDLNDDGYADIVLSNHYDGESYAIDSYIYWGAETGISSLERTSLPTLGASRVCVADFDDDEEMDLVFVNSQDDDSAQVSSYLYWNQEGSFSTNRYLELPTLGATECEAGDFNNDGYVDIAFANMHDDSSYSVDSYVYWNSYEGFTLPNRTGLPTVGATAVVSADVDLDGYRDLIFSGRYDGSSYRVNSYVYFGSADGFSSTDRVALPSIGTAGRAVVADLALDAKGPDGHPDILIPNAYDGSSGEVKVYIYRGPDFEDAPIELPAHGTTDVQVRDFNQDGLPDIFLAGSSPEGSPVDSYLYLGTASGYSSSSRQVLCPGSVADADAGDVDQDGFPDLLLAVPYDGGYQTNSVLYYGSAAGFSDAASLELETSGASLAALRDVDRDGYRDVIFAGPFDGDADTTGYVYWSSSRGLERAQKSELETSGAAHVNVAYLNRDAYPELIVSNAQDESGSAIDSYLLWGTATGPDEASRTALPTLGARMSCVGDLNRDGIPEIVFANETNGISREVNSYVYWGTTEGYGEAHRTGLPTLGAVACLLADLDRDGDLDVVFANRSSDLTDSVSSYVYWNDGGELSVSSRTGLPTEGAVAVVAQDLDGSGYLELVFTDDASRQADGGYAIYWGNSSGYAALAQTLDASQPVTAAWLGDLNADGYPDLVAAGGGDPAEEGTVYTYLYWGGEDGFSGDRTELEAGHTADLVVEDLNDDDFPEIVLASTGEGDTETSSYVFWGSNLGYSSANLTVLPTWRSAAAAVADLDEDGLADLVFASIEASDGTAEALVYYGSSIGYSTARVRTLPTLSVADLAVVDLDEDGWDDLVFAHAGDGGSLEVPSWVYWNSARGLSDSNRTEMPAVGATHMTVAGGAVGE